MIGICMDVKEVIRELKKDQDMHCLDERPYLTYPWVSLHRMNPLKVKARILKPKEVLC